MNRRLIFSTAAAALVLVAVGVIVGGSLHPDSGAHLLARTADEWSALGTFAAVVVAVWLGRREDRARSEELVRLRNERDEARAVREEDKERIAQEHKERQARDVVLWKTKHYVKAAGSWGEPILTVGFSNASQWPISNVTLVRHLTSGAEEMAAFAMVVEAGASSPGFTFSERVPASKDKLTATLVFRDAFGVYWRTDGKDLNPVGEFPELSGQATDSNTFRFIGREGTTPMQMSDQGSDRHMYGGPGPVATSADTESESSPT